VTDPVQFTVTLEDIRNTRRLQQRTAVLGAGTLLLAVGFVMLLLTRDPLALLVVAGALLGILVWWFPIFDPSLDRGRVSLGSVCEMRLDETGLSYRQSGTNGTFEATGHIGWSLMTSVREDDRVLLIRDGRITRAAIPKRAFPTVESLDAFRSQLLSSHRAIS